MIIHSTKLTRDLEEKIPDDLSAKMRDKLIRLLWSMRSGDRSMTEDCLSLLIELSKEIASMESFQRSHESSVFVARVAQGNLGQVIRDSWNRIQYSQKLENNE